MMDSVRKGRLSKYKKDSLAEDFLSDTTARAAAALWVNRKTAA
jgi:transposase-like protein